MRRKAYCVGLVVSTTGAGVKHEEIGYSCSAYCAYKYTLGPLQAGPPCCDPEPLIRVDKLSLHYGLKPALENVSLDIYKGCITALIGPSGCGKTSFLSVLNRIRYDSGLPCVGQCAF